jgi:uncharacterized protein YdaU (DUF1376 family)
MSTPPFMKFYPADYMADTRILSLEENGAYMLLLMTMWQHGGSLQNDEKSLARVCGVTPHKWRKIWASIDHYFEVIDGRVIQPRLAKEYKKAQEKMQKLSQNGRLGGEAKALKNNDAPLAKGSQKPLKAQKPEPEATSVATCTRDELDALETALRDAAGLQTNPSPNLFDLSPIIQLIDAGIDLERVILPKIRAMSARGRQVNSWRYFATAIAGDVSGASQTVSLPSMSPSGEAWETCLDIARKTQRWSAAWGPPPGSDGCNVPADMLKPGDGENWKLSGEAA